MAAAVIYSDKYETTLVQSTFTLPSFAVPAGANKRLVVVIESARGAGSTPARTISSVTWNGNSLTSQAQATSATGTGARLAIFDLALGSTTATSDISVTFSASSLGCIIHAFVVEDVEQGTPTPTAVSSNNLSDAITLSAAGIAIDGLSNCSNNTASNFSLTGATQTQTSLSPSRTGAGTTSEQNLGTSYATGSGSKTFTWTATNSPNKAHVIVGYLQASSSGISGSLSKTLGAVTATGAAKLAIKGTTARTLGAVTGASVGRLAITGAAACTLAALTGSATGSLAIAGTASCTLGAATASASGALRLTGVVGATLGDLASAARGALALTGALGATLGALTVTGRGGVPTGTDLTATPGRTFTATARARTYSGSGRERIFVLDTRARTF